MYSKDFSTIKQGLTSYIGAILEASDIKDGNMCRHNAVSILAEECLKLSTEKDGSYNTYVLKPIIRATVFILDQRCKELSKIESNSNTEKVIQEYKSICNSLNNLLDITKEGN